MASLVVIELSLVIIAGLVLGSFATALTWRVPRGIQWVRRGRDDEGGGAFARSACRSCGKALAIRDLVPVFSWLFLKGKCRQCGASIGWRYPAIEMLTLAGCLGIYIVWGFTVPAFLLMVAVAILAALLAIDIEHFILPDQLNLILVGIGALMISYQWAAYDFAYGFGRQAVLKLTGMVVFALVSLLAGMLVGRFLKKEALGLGDVKFFAVAGLLLGLTYLPFFLIVSGVIGVIWGGFYQFVLKKPVFPFGPALILALYCGLILQGLEIVPIIGVQ